MRSDVKPPGAASMPRMAPAPRSSSEEASSWPPRTSFVRKWLTRRPKGCRAQRRMGLRAHGSNNIRRNRVCIYLLRELHKSLFESDSAEAGVHFLHGARADDGAFLEDREVGAEAV